MWFHRLWNTPKQKLYSFLWFKKKLILTWTGTSVTSQVQYMKQVTKLQIIINQTACTVKKVVPTHAKKEHRGSWIIAPLILTLDADRSVSVINIMPQPVYPRERTWHPLNEWLIGPKSQSGHFREEFNLLPLPEFALWIIQPIHCKLVLNTLLDCCAIILAT
jgi:hypothetical protein